jgi:flagellar biosynthesis/type III secretory pathway chaperone
MNPLKAMLDEATRDCEAFVALLDQEQEALLQHDMALLQTLIEDKAPLLQALNRHDASLHALATQAGKTSDQGLEAFIDAQAEDALGQAYDQFKSALIRCQEANMRNARLVRHSQTANAHLVDLLRNQGESSQSVYDRQGLTSRSGSQRPLTKV